MSLCINIYTHSVYLLHLHLGLTVVSTKKVSFLLVYTPLRSGILQPRLMFEEFSNSSLVFHTVLPHFTRILNAISNVLSDKVECKSQTEKCNELLKYKVEVHPKPWGSINSLKWARMVCLLHSTLSIKTFEIVFKILVK